MEKIAFTKRQKELIQKAGINLPDKNEYNDNELIEIEEKLGDYHMISGFDENQNITSLGLELEEILNLL